MTSIPRSQYFCEKPSNKLRTKVTFHSEISRYALSTWIKQNYCISCSAKIVHRYLQKWTKSCLKLYALTLLLFCSYIWLHKSVLWAILLTKKFYPEIFLFLFFFGFLVRQSVNIFEPITLNVKPFQPSNAFICSSKFNVTSSYSP